MKTSTQSRSSSDKSFTLDFKKETLKDLTIKSNVRAGMKEVTKRACGTGTYEATC